MEDVSKTTITVLLALVIIISIIGTWSFLNAVSSLEHPAVYDTTNTDSSGNLKLTISKPPQSTSSSNIKLEVLKPEK